MFCEKNNSKCIFYHEIYQFDLDNKKIAYPFEDEKKTGLTVIYPFCDYEGKYLHEINEKEKNNCKHLKTFKEFKDW
jgi:hypothetical protein